MYADEWVSLYAFEIHCEVTHGRCFNFIYYTALTEVLTLHTWNLFYIMYKNSVRTSQETHYVSATKPNRLMPFK
jgi:hypothetical protein